MLLYIAIHLFKLEWNRGNQNAEKYRLAEIIKALSIGVAIAINLISGNISLTPRQRQQA